MAGEEGRQVIDGMDTPRNSHNGNLFLRVRAGVLAIRDTNARSRRICRVTHERGRRISDSLSRGINFSSG